MTGWGARLKGLLGGKAPSPPKKLAPQKAALQKTSKSSGNRAALIAEALEIRGRARVHAQEVLEKTFRELRTNPPKPSDVEGMTRLLNLRQAVLALKTNKSQDQQPAKGRPESANSGSRPPVKGSAAKTPPTRSPSQGTKR